MFIYLTKNQGGVYNPVLTIREIDGEKVLSPVGGYYIHRLQEFVKNNSLIPQDGYYETLHYSEYKAYCDALNYAFANYASFSEIEENMPLAFRLNEDGSKVEMYYCDNWHDYALDTGLINEDDYEEYDDDEYFDDDKQESEEQEIEVPIELIIDFCRKLTLR